MKEKNLEEQALYENSKRSRPMFTKQPYSTEHEQMESIRKLLHDPYKLERRIESLRESMKKRNTEQGLHYEYRGPSDKVKEQNESSRKLRVNAVNLKKTVDSLRESIQKRNTEFEVSAYSNNRTQKRNRIYRL